MIRALSPARFGKGRLTDDEALELFKELAAELDIDRPAWSEACGKSLKEWVKSPESKPRLSLAARVEFKSLEEMGFQRLYIERFRKEAELRNRLLRELDRADEALRTGDASGHAAQIMALDALIAYSGRTSASLEFLRKSLMGGKSSMRAEFNGRLAGLIEVMSWQSNAKAVYTGKDKTAKAVIALAEDFARRADITWAAEREGEKKGTTKVRSVYTAVKRFNWKHALDTSTGIDGRDMRPERWFFLEVVQSGYAAKERKEDLLKWSLERAKVYFDVDRLPPRDGLESVT